MIGRRGFLGGLLAMIAAPLAVKKVAPKLVGHEFTWSVPTCEVCKRRIWAGEYVSIPDRLHARCAMKAAKALRNLVDDGTTTAFVIGPTSHTTYPKLKRQR